MKTTESASGNSARMTIPFFSLLLGGVNVSMAGKHPAILYFDGVFALWIAYEILWKDFNPRFSGPILGLGTFCVIAGLISTVVNDHDPLKGIVAAKILGTGLLVFAVARSAPVGLMTPALVGACTSVLLLQSYQAVRYADYEGPAGLKDEIGMSMGRSNYVASILILLIPLAVAGAYTHRGKARWMCSICGALMCMGLFVTMSRGAMLAIVCAVLLSWPLLRRAGMKLREPVIVLGILGLSLAAAPRDLLETDIALFAFRLENPDYERQEIMKASWDSFLENPVVGVGPGQLGNAIAHHLLVPQYEVDYYNSHNLIINSLAEMGLPAGLALLIMIGIVMRNAWISASQVPNATNIAVWVALLAAVIHNMVEASFAGEQFQVVFWTIAAMVGNKTELAGA
jgi:O-antigen ligase